MFKKRLQYEKNQFKNKIVILENISTGKRIKHILYNLHRLKKNSI
jgi:hypothetical protein